MANRDIVGVSRGEGLLEEWRWWVGGFGDVGREEWNGTGESWIEKVHVVYFLFAWGYFTSEEEIEFFCADFLA